MQICFPFFQACRATQTHFLVRAAQNRRTQESEDEISYSLTQARVLSEPGEPSVRASRQAWASRRVRLELQLAFGQMTLVATAP